MDRRRFIHRDGPSRAALALSPRHLFFPAPDFPARVSAASARPALKALHGEAAWTSDVWRRDTTDMLQASVGLDETGGRPGGTTLALGFGDVRLFLS
jgi:hypothetical protein